MDSEAAQTPEAGNTIELIDIHRIMHDIPHRYPFLMLDRVVDVVLNSSAGRGQERHGQRKLLHRPFPEPPGHAGSDDHRKHGTDGRCACG